MTEREMRPNRAQRWAADTIGSLLLLLLAISAGASRPAAGVPAEPAANR
jgi:hypothetical protein